MLSPAMTAVRWGGYLWGFSSSQRRIGGGMGKEKQEVGLGGEVELILEY